jgi:FtsP/CotA-like multicopper oxidase with cupredoxin domain
MLRREFIRYGAVGAATYAVVGATPGHAATVSIALTIEPVDMQMVDGTTIFQLVFFAVINGQPTPRPNIRVRQGDQLTISVTNYSAIRCGFQVPGAAGSLISGIDPGQTRTVTFTAPNSGSYLYIDPTNAPVNRLVGLHGAFVSGPVNGTTPDGAPCPYSRTLQTPEVQAVFDAFGKPGRFPGQSWTPSNPNQEKIWLIANHDPSLNAAVDAGQSVVGSGVARTFLPRYFTLNGQSGFYASEDKNTKPQNYLGQPTLLRVMNAGLCTHSTHIHGNHILETASLGPNEPSSCLDNILEQDTWTMAPLHRCDVMLPYERPPDIPDAAWPPREEPFPLRYAMHCHTEMSQTAGGGNYPQGLVTHWEMLGLTPP